MSDNSSPQYSKVYYNAKEPESYAGANRLKRRFPLYTKDVSKWLRSQPSYTLHKTMRRRFPTRKYKVAAPNQLWQMDLMEMIPYARINDNFRYILTCIDVFTRFARAKPLKAKDGPSVRRAILDMMQTTIPRNVQTDLGKEFYNREVQSLFKEYKVNHYTVHSQFKAPLVERFNRTLRGRFNRLFTHRGNKIWFNVLPDIINAYNHSGHRGLDGKRPVDIEQIMPQWKEQERDDTPIKKRKAYEVGSLVRISRISVSDPFRKNFDQNWSEEIFRIAEIDTRERPTMYILKDLKDELIEGKFYHEELQVVDSELPRYFRIERIIRTRGKGKHKQYLVKWYGYDNTYNSWIQHSDFLQPGNE